MYEIKEVKISNICDFFSGDKSITRTTLQAKRGNIPVYAATLDRPLGYTSEAKNGGRTLLVVNDGINAGKTYVVEDCQFTIGKHVCGLKIKEEYTDQIDLDYVQLVGEPIFQKSAKGDGQKNLPQIMVKNTRIPIPIKSDGLYDFNRQREYSVKHKRIEAQKELLRQKRATVNGFKMMEFDVSHTKNVKVKKLFSVERGKALYTQEYCSAHAGAYPIYTAKNDCPAGYINTFDYDGEYLTISLNGIAGIVTLMCGRFSCSADRAVLIPLCGDLDLQYIKCVSQDIFRKKIKGRLGENGKNEYTKLGTSALKEIGIPIPIKVDETYDLEVQKEIAVKYNAVERIKREICRKLDAITE